MKKINLLILPLIALSIAGCSRGSTSSASNDQISEKQSSTSSSSSSSSSSAPKASSSSSSSVAEESTSSTVDVYSLGWSRTVVDKMLKYLNNTVLPYVNLGKSTYVEAEWAVSSSDFGVLKIAGTEEWDGTTTPAILTAAFSADAGWNITKNDTAGFEATLTDAKVSVNIGPASTSSYSPDPTLTIKASYDEEYDLTAATAWDAETAQVFTDNFGVVAPFVYLGTKNPYAEYSSYSNKITISGGKWNAQVIQDAWSTLNAAGYTVGISGTTLTATGKISSADDDEFSITIEKSGYSAEKISMSVKLTEAWNPTAQTAWPQTVQTEITTNLDGHEIPYLWLGTKNPTTYYYSSYNELDIRGNASITDDQLQQIFTLSETSFSEDDGWTLVSDERNSTSSKQITYKKKFDSDNCIIKCIVKESYSYGAIIECYLSAGIVVPSTSTEWSSATQTLMTDNFHEILPYAYLNTATETAVWDADTSTLTITGGTWVNSQGELVGEVYSNDATMESDGTTKKWNWTVGAADYSGVVKIEGKKADGTRYKITIQNTSGNAEMKIVYIPVYQTNDDGWDTGVKTAMTQYLDGHVIPYVYLRSGKCYTYWSSYSSYLQIKGGEWDEGMVTAMETVYTADGWTLVSKSQAVGSDAGKIRYKKAMGDGCVIEVLLNRYSSSTTVAEMMVWITSEYNEASKQTEWNDTAKAEIAKSSHLVVPYVYLASKAPSVSYSSGGSYYTYTDKVTFKGGTWDDRVLTEGKANLIDGGYTMYESKNDYGKMAIGYMKDTTNSIFTTVILYRDSSNMCCMDFYTSPLAGISESGSWAADIDTAIKGYTEADFDMDYLSLGGNVSFTTDTGHATLKSADKLTHERSFVIYEQLKNAGWEDLVIKTSASDLKVMASKNLGTNKGSVSVSIDQYSVATCYLNYYPPFIAPENVTSWGDGIEGLMDTNFGHRIPYFYIGADSPSSNYSSYSQKLELTGITWDDRVFDNAIAAFTADSNATWSYIWDYSSTTTDTLVFTTEFSDGKHMTVKVYKYVGTSSSYPQVDIYCR